MGKEELDLRPHSIETEDGYILSLIHIWSLNEEVKKVENKGVILLQHGISMDGLSWFKTDNESLPSLLIKAGYKVYLGNDRGTRNS